MIGNLINIRLLKSIIDFNWLIMDILTARKFDTSPLPLTKPLLKRGVTIQLDDETQIKLSREVASKLNTVRSAIDYLLNIKGKTEDEAYQTIIPVTYYPAQYIRRYLELMAKIDKREQLANIRLSQLFGLFLEAMYMGNETSMTNLADYILATVYASREMGDDMKKEIKRLYSAGPAEPKRFIMRRLAELNRTVSVKNLRNIDFNGWLLEAISIQSYLADEPVDRLAIDKWGRITASLLTKYRKRFYEENNLQRESLINQFLIKHKYDQPIVRVGGMTDQGATIITAYSERQSEILGRWSIFSRRPHVDVWRYTVYLPGQLSGKLLSGIIGRKYEWKILPLAPRLKIEFSNLYDILQQADNLLKTDKLDELLRERIEYWKEFRIYDLTNQTLLFTYHLGWDMVEAIDHFGKYVVIIFNIIRGGMVIELFDIEANSPSKSKRISRTIVLHHKAERCIIDPYHKQLYIFDKGLIRRQGFQHEMDVSIILVINFMGQVLHRYVFPGELDLYPRSKEIISAEALWLDVTREQNLRGRGLLSAEDLKQIRLPRDVTRGGHLDLMSMDILRLQKAAKLPRYELWPVIWPTQTTDSSVSLPDDILHSYKHKGVWLREVSDGFRPLALLQESPFSNQSWVGQVNLDQVIMSPGGDYVLPVKRLRIESPLPLIKTVVYSEGDVELINEVLSGPAKK